MSLTIPGKMDGSAKARAEMIALLYLLHTVPVTPSSNSIDPLPHWSDGYSLTLKNERELASILAFLSNIKDDPDHIPAICLAEIRQSASIQVLLAVNKATPNDGNQILQGIKAGFETIFSVLVNVVDGAESSATVEQQVFHAIIKMCQTRVLCRLRLVAKRRTSTKLPFKDVIQQTIQTLQRLDSDNKSKIEDGKDVELQLIVKSFTVQAKEIIRLTDAWTKHQTLTRLCELVESIRQLRHVEGLQAMLDSIPSRHMDPSMRKSLYNIVSKVARYREAASFLFRLGKRVPVVRKMEVILVKLPEAGFYKAPVLQDSSSLTSVLAQIGPPRELKKDISSMCRLLGNNENELDRQFSQQTRKILKDAKIHAEVQLVYHCALKTVTLPPRVVCSSKDACFLCNMFVLAYGKMHTPRSHGRLYPGWRIPHLPVLRKVEKRFGQVLRDNIRGSLTTLLSRQQKTVYPDPNESTLLTLIHSRSTLVSLSVPSGVHENNTNVVPSQVSKQLETSPNVSESCVTPVSTPRVQDCSLEVTSQSALTRNREERTRHQSQQSLSNEIENDTVDNISTASNRGRLSMEQSNTSHRSTSATPIRDNISFDQLAWPTGDVLLKGGQKTIGMCDANESVTACHRPPSSIANGTTHHLPDMQIQPLPDLDRQRAHAAIMRGHESRICNTPSGHSTSEAKLDRRFKVMHSDGVVQRLDFHDLELFFEVESPASAMILVRTGVRHQSLDTSLAMDIGRLAPGEETTVQADNTQSAEKTICLILRDKTKTEQQYEINWEIVE